MFIEVACLFLLILGIIMLYHVISFFPLSPPNLPLHPHTPSAALFQFYFQCYTCHPGPWKRVLLAFIPRPTSSYLKTTLWWAPFSPGWSPEPPGSPSQLCNQHWADFIKSWLKESHKSWHLTNPDCSCWSVRRGSSNNVSTLLPSVDRDSEGNPQSLGCIKLLIVYCYLHIVLCFSYSSLYETKS